MSARRVIELLDSSDVDEEEDFVTPAHSDVDHHSSDGIVTPELPPADASALPIPESIEALPTTPDLPTIEDDDDDAPSLESSQMQLDGVPADRSPTPTPPPPPDPLANQPRMFDPEELNEVFDDLKALLEAEEASDAENDDEDYEERRRRKLRANEALLAQLGLAASGGKEDDTTMVDADAEEDDDAEDEPTKSNDTPARGRGRPKKQVRTKPSRPTDAGPDSRSHNKAHRKSVKFAEDGTTKSAPPRGETFVLAYIEMPTLRDRARNDFVFVRDVPEITAEDLASWSEDEEEEPDAEDVIDLDAILDDVDAKGRTKTKRVNFQPDVLPDGTRLSSCHQCRRKTADPKMRCHRIRQGVQCPYHYCQRCIRVRYGMDFNEDDTNFQCPRCLGYCNCTTCLRRSGFGDMVSKGRQRLVAFSDELRKLAGQDGLKSMQGRIGAILAETAALNTEEPPAKRRKTERATRRDSIDPKASYPGVPKKRGRPPKKQREHLTAAEIKIELLDLPDEVAIGEVFSPLEEHALGKMAVARHVLKLVAAHEASEPVQPVEQVKQTKQTKPKRKLVVKLSRPQRTFAVAAPSVQAVEREEERKVPNYHDMEKNVWVRSAADYSTSESEVDELADAGTDEEDEDPQDRTETVFEEGCTQAFAASVPGQQNNDSAATSCESSPLTSVDESLSSASVASSKYGEGKDASRQADVAEKSQTSTQESLATVFPQASLAMPNDMQQLALAVLGDHDEPNKAIHAGAFPTSSDTEAGQLGALLDAEPTSGTPVLFANSPHYQV